MRGDAESHRAAIPGSAPSSGAGGEDTPHVLRGCGGRARPGGGGQRDRQLNAVSPPAGRRSCTRGTYGAAADPAEGPGAGEEPPQRGSGAPWRLLGETPRAPSPCRCPARGGPVPPARAPMSFRWRSLVPRRPWTRLKRSIRAAKSIASRRGVEAGGDIGRPGGAPAARSHRGTAPAHPPPGAGIPALAQPGLLPRRGAALPAQGAARSPPHVESAINCPILSFGNTNYLITPRCRTYLSAQLARTIIKIRRPNYVSI